MTLETFRRKAAVLLLASSFGLLVACGGKIDDDPTAIPVIPPATSALEAVPSSRLCVTEGSLAEAAPDHKVNGGGMRAVIAGDRSRAAELAFTFRGESPVERRLGSGELRRQIGLKLRAQDSCNVVYVMWHVAPTSQLQVLVKNNPGADRHAECGTGGYSKLEPSRSAKVPVLIAAERHTLRAELDERHLTVFADGALVWEGDLPAEVLAFDGPAGVRSDNGEFDFELRVPDGSAGSSCR